jgi:two-component system NtrC family sensor kinase
VEEMWLSNEQRILWFSKAKKKIQSFSSNYRIDLFVDSDLISDALASDYYSTVIVEFGSNESECLEILKTAKKLAPQTTRILIGSQITDELMIAAVNVGGVFATLLEPFDNLRLTEVLSLATDQFRNSLNRKKLLEEIRIQNRKLENLNINLENMVLERTNHLEAANQEAEKSLTHMRDLTHFVQELSHLRAIDELLQLIYKELKHFHELRPPILNYVSLDSTAKIVSIQGKQIFEKTVRHLWPSKNEIRINDRADQKYLANEFGRPLQKIIALPLSQKLTKNFREEDPLPHLYFEHNFSEHEIEGFLSATKDWLQPISIALDRIILEKHLKFTSQQWESTFDGIKDPIAIIDSHFEIVRANRHFTSKSFAKKCHQAFQNQEEVCAGCPMQLALTSNKSQRGIVKKADRVFEVYSYPIRLDAETTSAAVINHYVDVTLTRELQGKVVQTEKMAAIGYLAGNIAHELNNPLTGIRSLSQILIAEIKDAPQLIDDLGEVERASERSQKIIENLLQFSKGSTLQSRNSKVSLNEIIRKTLPMLKTSFREHRTNIIFEETEAQVFVEPQLVQQVVFNLVNNACQAMKNQGTLRIESKVEIIEEQKFCVIEIEDTGEGIAEHLRESIFEAFFTTKEEGQGTGLGLSMSRNIVRKFEGDIKVESQVGVGSIFKVILPYVEPAKGGT